MTLPWDLVAKDTCTLPPSFQDAGDDLQMAPGGGALPPHVLRRFNDYVSDRVGPQIAQTLRIREIWYVQQTSAVGRSSRRSSDSSDVAYAVFVGLPVADDMSSCGNYVDREYCAGTWLNSVGQPLTEIGLPRMAQNPAKAHLLTRAEAEAVAADMRFKADRSYLKYQPDLDILVWYMEGDLRQRDGESTLVGCSLNAHTGAFMGWHEFNVLYAR
jgi:hypothetical protein